nr:unnamed protein product [Callosobruchus analis]
MNVGSDAGESVLGITEGDNRQHIPSSPDAKGSKRYGGEQRENFVSREEICKHWWWYIWKIELPMKKAKTKRIYLNSYPPSQRTSVFMIARFVGEVGTVLMEGAENTEGRLCEQAYEKKLQPREMMKIENKKLKLHPEKNEAHLRKTGFTEHDDITTLRSKLSVLRKRNEKKKLSDDEAKEEKKEGEEEKDEDMPQIEDVVEDEDENKEDEKKIKKISAGMKHIGIQVRPYFRSKQTQTYVIKVIHTSSSPIKSIVMNVPTSPIKPPKMPMKEVSKVVPPLDDTSDADTSTSYYIPGTTSQPSDTAAAVIEAYSAIALKYTKHLVSTIRRYHK